MTTELALDAPPAIRVELAPWRSGREAVRAAFLLGVREVRMSLRTPAYFIPNLIVPIFFYFVMVGALEEFAGRSGIDNWQASSSPSRSSSQCRGAAPGSTWSPTSRAGTSKSCC